MVACFLVWAYSKYCCYIAIVSFKVNISNQVMIFLSLANHHFGVSLNSVRYFLLVSVMHGVISVYSYPNYNVSNGSHGYKVS